MAIDSVSRAEQSSASKASEASKKSAVEKRDADANAQEKKVSSRRAELENSPKDRDTGKAVDVEA